MKRSIDATDLQTFLKDGSEPEPKVMLVEREEKPGGISLVNPNAIAKKSYTDSMELSEGLSNVNTAMHANARNKLDVIGRQMRNLQDLMSNVFEETKLSIELHNVACNFVKKPGHIYHLYEKSSGQKYLGMLSPEEWQNAPHNYLGSYMLESDLNWTPARSIDGRYEGVNFLKQFFGIPHLQALS
ncbi:uncharacterized protein C1orf50 homolog [Tribolium madens]|uniref:uncharacterized protein C1orf50 homolog n=1 Tax=Tribolium madens TaxID=41895 RepID=UPI001CF76247|nr:uncharacterized protein C1orf50 homolog [Tribolium madens]